MAAVILRLKTRKKKKKKKDSIRSSSKKKRSTRSVPGAIGSRIGTNFEEGRIEREVWPMMRKGQGGFIWESGEVPTSRRQRGKGSPVEAGFYVP